MNQRFGSIFDCKGNAIFCKTKTFRAKTSIVVQIWSCSDMELQGGGCVTQLVDRGT